MTEKTPAQAIEFLSNMCAANRCGILYVEPDWGSVERAIGQRDYFTRLCVKLDADIPPFTLEVSNLAEFCERIAIAGGNLKRLRKITVGRDEIPSFRSRALAHQYSGGEYEWRKF